MVFSSLVFLFRFLPVMLLAYYVVPARLRNGILFIGSLIFYGYGEPYYVTLLLFSTIVDYVHGRAVERYQVRGNMKGAKLMLLSSVIINLSLLGFFKYFDFFVEIIRSITGADIPFLNLTLPVGISFYTFQTMSYTIDVYCGKIKAQKSLVAFGAYVSMFPQLIAGPIVRYSTIAEELKERKESLSDFSTGICLFSVGLGKKVLIANQLGQIWDKILKVIPGEQSILMAWIGILAYGLQIYFDFSGYSDMACGLGRMFGFHFPENFHYPYESASITEFWRRWHISLGTWFKEYVYIPLGGSRCSILIQIRNIMIIWLLTGIWHGASWNFLLWGIYFGVLLLIEKLFLKNILGHLPKWMQHMYTLLLVFLGWVLFAFDDIEQGVLYFNRMFGQGSRLFSERTWYLIDTNFILLVIAVIGSTSIPYKYWIKYKNEKFAAALSLFYVPVILLLCTAFLVNAGYNPFLYFRF